MDDTSLSSIRATPPPPSLEEAIDFALDTVVAVQQCSTVFKMRLRGGEVEMGATKGAYAAVKLISSTDPRGQEWFSRECAALRRIPPHPALPRLLAASSELSIPRAEPEPGSTWRFAVATTFFKGAPLHKLFYEFPRLELDFLRSVGWQVAQAMHHIHAAGGIVHRDLKISNVLLRLDGTIAVVDLGHSAIAGEVPRESVAVEAAGEAAFGTLHIRAPETFCGSPCDPASDFFSFGMLLAELACGRTPFGFDTRSTSLTEDRVERDLCAVLRERYSQMGEGGDRAADTEALCDLLRALLECDPKRRLRDWVAVQAHGWFARGCGGAAARWDAALFLRVAEPYLEEVEMQTLGL